LHSISFFGVRLELEKWNELIKYLKKQGVLHSEKVEKAIQAVPRSAFLPPDMKSYSATDTPLPIGFGQTISAPHSSSLSLN
jgi:protein-L-isoaspartate(D-aspartate) O-methyltransferase